MIFFLILAMYVVYIMLKDSLIQILAVNFSVSENLHKLLCLFVLRFNVPVNNFSVMSGRSHYFMGITSTFGE